MEYTSIHHLALPASFTIDTVEALVEHVKLIDANTLSLVVDISGTEIITTPGIQLLFALQAHFSSHQHFSLTGVREPVRLAFHQLGLSETLRQWETETAQSLA